MIKMPAITMALNGPDVLEYKMWNTRLVASDVAARWLADNTAAIAGSAPNGQLEALVFNCHGFVDAKGAFRGLDLGTGIKQSDLKHFSRLKNLVPKIYIVACQAAAGQAGRRFCAELARQTRAFVYASDVNQHCGFSSAQAVLNGGVIDDYEGQVFQFGSSGDVSPVTL
jgi:hypothetical protein